MPSVYTNVYEKRICFVTYRVGREHTDIKEALSKPRAIENLNPKG
jgi:hypothetical protein